MTIEKAIFYGFGAWVGRIDGETRCGFWTRHPAEVNFDPILLIPVDLSKTPSAAQKGKIDWDEILSPPKGSEPEPEPPHPTPTR